MVGIVGATKPVGNTRLVESGIQTEDSDLRVHISVSAWRAYVYSTKNGLATIKRGTFTKRPVFTGSIKTAEGYLVPPDSIPGCLCIPIPKDTGITFDRMDNTTQKGQKAVGITKLMLKRKLIPMPLDVAEITDEMMQISGTDILVTAKVKIQVKCDYSAGHKEFGGTGNLFLQVSECNPYKRH